MFSRPALVPPGCGDATTTLSPALTGGAFLLIAPLSRRDGGARRRVVPLLPRVVALLRWIVALLLRIIALLGRVIARLLWGVIALLRRVSSRAADCSKPDMDRLPPRWR